MSLLSTLAIMPILYQLLDTESTWNVPCLLHKTYSALPLTNIYFFFGISSTVNLKQFSD